MILAFDTYYFDDKANTVCIGFNAWQDDTPIIIKSELLLGIAAYEAGLFYKRELPCILSLLKTFDLSQVTSIVIDGYVVLDNEGKNGLGGYLYEQLDKKIPVVGVAKSKFSLNEDKALPLYRGESKRSLFISAKGMALQTAYEHIKQMHGSYRMPTLLQILYTKTKSKDE